MATKSMTKTNTNDEEVVVEKKKFSNSDPIPCRSIVNGGLYITGPRSNIFYSWADYGDVIDVEFQDLSNMVRTPANKDIYEPRIIIEDEEFIRQNKSLTELYESLYSTKDLRDIINLPVAKMKQEIEKLPNGVKNALKGIASTMINSHQLDSVQKIKALDEIYGTQMLLTLVQE